MCGATVMGQDVISLVKDLVFGGSEEAIKKLEKEKRIIKELWG